MASAEKSFNLPFFKQADWYFFSTIPQWQNLKINSSSVSITNLILLSDELLSHLIQQISDFAISVTVRDGAVDAVLQHQAPVGRVRVYLIVWEPESRQVLQFGEGKREIL